MLDGRPAISVSGGTSARVRSGKTREAASQANDNGRRVPPAVGQLLVAKVLLGGSRCDPVADQLELIRRELAEVRLGGRLDLNQQATWRVTGHDHRAAHAALHQAGIGRNVQALLPVGAVAPSAAHVWSSGPTDGAVVRQRRSAAAGAGSGSAWEAAPPGWPAVPGSVEPAYVQALPWQALLEQKELLSLPRRSLCCGNPNTRRRRRRGGAGSSWC